MKKRITVITVVFNAREALEKTIRSVVSQDYEDIEYIVVDGGSKDGSVEVIKSHGESIDRWISERDRGIYDAMNKGVRLATGDYCIFMNAGDTFASADTVSRVFAGPRTADVVYGDIMKDGQLKRALSPRNCHKMYYCHQAVFTRTAVLREIPFDISHTFSADFKQAKQMFLAGKTFCQVAIPVADFDTSGVSNTSRSRGLWDNMKVVCEVDSLKDRCRFLPHLLFPWLMCRLRGK